MFEKLSSTNWIFSLFQIWFFRLTQAVKINRNRLKIQFVELDFSNLICQNSSSTNWISSLHKSISKLIFAGYTGSKNQVWNRLKIQFVELNFPKLIFQKSSTDQQGVRFCLLKTSLHIIYRNRASRLLHQRSLKKIKEVKISKYDYKMIVVV